MIRKINLTIVFLAVLAASSFAADKTPKAKPAAKKEVKCQMGGSCCKKSCDKAEIMKASASKAAVKKA